MFYKIENGNLKRLRLPLRIDDKDVFTNDESIISENGYYRLDMDDYPEDHEKTYEQRFEIQNGVIHGTWTEVSVNV